MTADQPKHADPTSIELVGAVIGTRNFHPLVACLRDGGTDTVRDALCVLAEYDPDLLVQTALDALSAHADEPPSGRPA